MNNDEIELRIRIVQTELAKPNLHVDTLMMLNRCLEHLILMEPDDEINDEE